MSKKKPAKKRVRNPRPTAERWGAPLAQAENCPVHYQAPPQAPEGKRVEKSSPFDDANNRLAGGITRAADLATTLRSRLSDFLGPGAPATDRAATGEGGPPALARIGAQTAAVSLLGDVLADILDRLVV